MAQGIYCFEGEWGPARDRRTVEPVLGLLRDCDRTPYIHRNVPTPDTLRYYAKRWLSLTSMPIGYFACHGDRGRLLFSEEGLTLDDFATILGGKCDGKILFFSSCSTMATKGEDLKELCRATNARGLVGYTKTVDFVEAAAFEVLLLRDLLHSTNFKSVYTRMGREHPYMSKRLGLRMAHKTWASPQSVARGALDNA